MWVARNKDGMLTLFEGYPTRNEEQGTWMYYTIFSDARPQWAHDFSSKILNAKLFPDLTWDDDPIEVNLVAAESEWNNDSITLTRYHENYDEAREWFFNMLKRQERYKNYTEDQIEEVWQDHIKEEYRYDEIWSTVQCDGYTKVIFPMGRHDSQPDYDCVCETKEYIDSIINKSY